MKKTNQKYSYQHVLEQAFRIFKSQKAIGHFLLRCGGQYPLSSVHTFYFLFKQTLKVNRQHMWEHNSGTDLRPNLLEKQFKIPDSG